MSELTALISALEKAANKNKASDAEVSALQGIESALADVVAALEGGVSAADIAQALSAAMRGLTISPVVNVAAPEVKVNVAAPTVNCPVSVPEIKPVVHIVERGGQTTMHEFKFQFSADGRPVGLTGTSKRT